MKHFFIGEANNCETSIHQDLVPIGVIIALCLTNAPINLDHQESRVAVKIHDEALDHLLPAEMQLLQLVAAQALP